LSWALSQLKRDIRPVVIISAYNKVLQTALETVSCVSVPINTCNDVQMLALIKTSIGTKFVARWADPMCRRTLDAVHTVVADDASGARTINIKCYASVERVPGGEVEDSRVITNGSCFLIVRSSTRRAKARRPSRFRRRQVLRGSIRSRRNRSRR